MSGDLARAAVEFHNPVPAYAERASCPGYVHVQALAPRDERGRSHRRIGLGQDKARPAPRAGRGGRRPGRPSDAIWAVSASEVMVVDGCSLAIRAVDLARGGRRLGGQRWTPNSSLAAMPMRSGYLPSESATVLHPCGHRSSEASCSAHEALGFSSPPSHTLRPMENGRLSCLDSTIRPPKGKRPVPLENRVLGPFGSISRPATFARARSAARFKERPRVLTTAEQAAFQRALRRSAKMIHKAKRGTV